MITTRTLLRTNRDFRRLMLASVVSLTGDWFSFVAVADLVTELTGRPGAAAFVYAATVLPVFVASPVAGVIADKLDRKRVMIVADLVRVPIALALCVAAWTSSVPLAIVAIILLGIGASFYDPVASAATPNLVAPEELALAQSLMGAVWGSMLLVGAGLGGLVAEVFGRTAAFSVDAASFVISALLIAGIRKPTQEARTPRTSGQPGVREALAYVRRDPVVSRLVLAKGVGWANGIVGLLPAFARIKFAGTNIATGLFFAARSATPVEELWGLTGLLHDFDYEKWPSLQDHPYRGNEILQERGWSDEIRRAIMSHAEYSGVSRDTPMEKALFACDELAGFITAVTLVKPSKSLAEVDAKSVRKKMKDKAFARSVNRDDIINGAAALGVELEEHIAFCIEAMKGVASTLGLDGSAAKPA